MNFVSRTAENDYPFDRCVVAQRVVNIFLEWHDCTAPMCAVRCHDSNRAAVDNAVTNAIGAKSTENHRMHRADSRAGQHCNRGFGNIREINDDPIAPSDLVSLEDIRESANFAMQLLIGEGALIARLPLPDNCCFVPAGAG